MLAAYDKDDNWPIPPSLYELFPILKASAETACAWVLDCECSKCTKLRAVIPAPISPKKNHRGVWKNQNNVLKLAMNRGVNYPCGHPRTQNNSYAGPAGYGMCRECQRNYNSSRRKRARKILAEKRMLL